MNIKLTAQNTQWNFLDAFSYKTHCNYWFFKIHFSKYAYKTSGYQNLASKLSQDSTAHSEACKYPGGYSQLCLG